MNFSLLGMLLCAVLVGSQEGCWPSVQEQQYYQYGVRDDRGLLDSDGSASYVTAASSYDTVISSNFSGGKMRSHPSVDSFSEIDDESDDDNPPQIQLSLIHI